MADENEDFLKTLLATFQVEAGEHLETMSSGLLALERATSADERLEILETIFREAHSLKGAARAVNRSQIESVCHSLESLFAGLKHQRVATSPALFDLVHQGLEALAGLLASEKTTDRSTLAALILHLENASKGVPPARVEPPVSPAATLPTADSVASLPRPAPTSGTVRIRLEKLDAVMRQTEELFAPRLAAGQRAAELRETGAVLAEWKRKRARIGPFLRSIEWSMTHPRDPGDASKGDSDVPKLIEVLEAANALIERVEDQVSRLEKSADADHRALEGMVSNLLHDVKEMQMLPFSSLLEPFPRLARELARNQGKHVELVTRGGEIEIDRRILEEMKSPLIHLVRNCVDHGIEKPAEREQKGKPRQGTVTITISHRDSRNVEILLTDDGAGIDIGKIRAAAVGLGLVTVDQLDRLDERETLALVFRSGFSTSPIITDLSGRGLGLAIVREKVDQLGGRISVETWVDAGSTVRIALPLTLANFRGIVVRVCDQLFIIPGASVARVARVAGSEIRTVENRETIPLDGRTVSLVWLCDVLELPRAKGASAENAQVVVLGLGADRIAFRVDAILFEQEVMVKGLGRQLARVRNVAGASVLGTGQVVPVLDVHDLMQSATRAVRAPAALSAERVKDTVRRSILVVEDSITARSLLKNILESAGYDVTTAVDGVDALTTIRISGFDLIVSDVEMPRMDGFELTARVRADKQLAGLPVVLVTALESREHRERGVDVGANAYIVKSSFDQSNLLDAIRRLIP